MPDQALTLLTTHLPDTHLALFVHRLTQWLLADHNEQEDAPAFTESRAKALLRATNVIDDPTLKDFFQRMEKRNGRSRRPYTRLLNETELANNEEVMALAATSGSGDPTVDYHASKFLFVTCHFSLCLPKRLSAQHSSTPPHRPLNLVLPGQIIKRAGYWMRQQIQRSATERDKLAKKLAYSGGSNWCSHTES